MATLLSTARVATLFFRMPIRTGWDPVLAPLAVVSSPIAHTPLQASPSPPRALLLPPIRLDLAHAGILQHAWPHAGEWVHAHHTHTHTTQLGLSRWHLAGPNGLR